LRLMPRWRRSRAVTPPCQWRASTCTCGPHQERLSRRWLIIDGFHAYCRLLQRMQLICTVWVEFLNTPSGRGENMHILSETCVSITAWPSVHWSPFVRCFVCNKPKSQIYTQL
jgi:hypothetical protein